MGIIILKIIFKVRCCKSINRVIIILHRLIDSIKNKTVCIIKHGRSKFDELEKEDKLIIKTFIDKHVPYIRFFVLFCFFACHKHY